MIQSFSTYQSSRPIGVANANAVNAESWRGEMFLVDNIVRRYKEQGARHKTANVHCSPLGAGGLQLKLISNPLYRSDAINTQLLPDLADMYVNRAVANDDIVAPNLV